MSPRFQGRLATGVLIAVVALLPFEPRRPVLPLFGFEFTVLEIVAGLGLLILLALGADRLSALARRPPAPLLALVGYAGAHLVSAILAPDNWGLAVVSSLRIVAAAGFALAVATTTAPTRRAGYGALVAGAVVVAALSLGEALGVRGLDPFLDFFRGQAFVVGALRRSSGASENPNLAAAFLMYGLVAGSALAARRRAGLGFVAALAILLSLGLTCTYSRGAILAALGALAVLALRLEPGADRRVPLVALAAVLLSSLAFAAAGSLLWTRVRDEASGQEYRARYEPGERSLLLRPGETRPGTVRITNEGRQTWSPEAGFRAHYDWYDLDRGLKIAGWGTLIAHPVAPGEVLRHEAVLHAPYREGRYILAWDMGGDPVGMFSAFGVEPGRVSVVVSASPVSVPSPAGVTPAPAPAVPDLSLPRGRIAIWKSALAMWREHPWTGVGSDNFRQLQWRHQPWRAGREETQYSAHSLYLEAAASTGLLGLVLLLATLGLTLGRLAALAHATDRDTRLEAALLTAATAALALHGLVEHVLGFTGHYLFLGLVVGATSALACESRPPLASRPSRDAGG